MRYVKPLQLYQDFMQIWMQSEAIGCPALAALHVDNNNKWLMTEKTDEDFFFPKEDGLTKVPFFIKGSQVRSTYLVDEEESKEEECETEEEVEEGAEEDDDVVNS
ncbi:hypothetical protein ACOSQ2_011723 [Xanthoceras sorbifolium]